MIKKAVREETGKNVTESSSTKEVWKAVGDILKLERLSKNTLEIEHDNRIIDDPAELAEAFNSFFKEKPEKLAAGIEKEANVDPLKHLRAKLKNSKLDFQTVGSWRTGLHSLLFFLRTLCKCKFCSLGFTI